MSNIWWPINEGHIVAGIPAAIVVIGLVGGIVYALHSYFITEKPGRDKARAARAEREALLSNQSDGTAIDRWLSQAGSEADHADRP